MTVMKKHQDLGQGADKISISELKWHNNRERTHRHSGSQPMTCKSEDVPGP